MNPVCDQFNAGFLYITRQKSSEDVTEAGIDIMWPVLSRMWAVLLKSIVMGTPALVDVVEGVRDPLVLQNAVSLLT